MRRITQLGTVVRVPDGRIGTVVFNGLTGVGIKWGEHRPDLGDFKGTCGDLFDQKRPDGWEWEPDAMLRDPNMTDALGMECVCEADRAEIITGSGEEGEG